MSKLYLHLNYSSLWTDSNERGEMKGKETRDKEREQIESEEENIELNTSNIKWNFIYISKTSSQAFEWCDKLCGNPLVNVRKGSHV